MGLASVMTVNLRIADVMRKTQKFSTGAIIIISHHNYIR